MITETRISGLTAVESLNLPLRRYSGVAYALQYNWCFFSRIQPLNDD